MSDTLVNRCYSTVRCTIVNGNLVSITTKGIRSTILYNNLYETVILSPPPALIDPSGVYLLGGDTGPSVVSRRSETEQGILCINEDMVKYDMVGLGNEVYLWDEYVRVRTLWILTVDTHRNIQIFKSQKIITHITPNRESRKIQKGPPKGKEGVYKEKSDFLRENDQ
jgi:hypothetical protein